MAPLWQTAADYFTSSSGWSVVLYWWFCLLVPGLLALPLTARLSTRQFDAAYPLAKVLGLAMPAYAVWLLSSLHAAPFVRPTIFVVLAMLAVIGAGLAWKDRAVLRGAKFWRMVLVEEAMFLLILTAWGLLRYVRPDILDIEKFMNFAFLNASLRTDYMPPMDPWFAHAPINYYYFGHFLWAYVIKLGGFAPSYGYNLAFATLPAMAFVLTFSIAANAVVFLRRAVGRGEGVPPLRPAGVSPARNSTSNSAERQASSPQQCLDVVSQSPAPLRLPWRGTPIVAGLISAVLMVGGGNLHTFIYGVVQPVVGEVVAGPAAATQPVFSKGMKDARPYFWSDPRSYIGHNPDTGDKTITEFPAYAFILGDLHGHVMNLVLVLALLLLLLFFLCRSSPTGAAAERWWSDFPFVLLAGWLLGLFVMTNTWDFPIHGSLAAIVILARWWRDEKRWLREFLLAGGQFVLVSGLPLLVAWPFLHHFDAPAKQVHAVLAHSPLWQLAIVWGQQALLMTLFVGAVVWGWFKGRRWGGRLAAADAFFLVCLLVALGCILLPEVVYIQDIFGVGYHRANTMFKFSFQGFALTAVASGYIARRLVGLARVWATRLPIAAALGVWLLLPMLFIGFAVRGYYLDTPSNSSGLDGLAYMKARAPEDVGIIHFLNRQAGPGNILEATGEPYTYSGRISVATGRATIIGWKWHEILWRAGPGAMEVEARQKAAADIYGPADAATTRQLLEKYHVRYIVIGAHERQQMANINDEKLRLLTTPVFADGAGVVLEYPRMLSTNGTNCTKKTEASRQ